MDRNVYRFDRFELDASRRRLKRDGVGVTLPARQFDLLNFFVANPRRVISVDAIIEAVWTGVAGEPNNVVQAVKGLRKALSSNLRTYRASQRPDDGVRTKGRRESALRDLLLTASRRLTKTSAVSAR